MNRPGSHPPSWRNPSMTHQSPHCWGCYSVAPFSLAHYSSVSCLGLAQLWSNVFSLQSTTGLGWIWEVTSPPFQCCCQPVFGVLKAARDHHIREMGTWGGLSSGSDVTPPSFLLDIFIPINTVGACFIIQKRGWNLNAGRVGSRWERSEEVLRK